MAVHGNTDIVVEAAHDIWALGVMAFEAIVQSQTLESLGDIRRCAEGKQAYPWELPAEQQSISWRQSKLRGVVMPCLSRESVARPSALEVLDSVAQLGRATTMRA